MEIIFRFHNSRGVMATQILKTNNGDEAIIPRVGEIVDMEEAIVIPNSKGRVFDVIYCLARTPKQVFIMVKSLLCE